MVRMIAIVSLLLCGCFPTPQERNTTRQSRTTYHKDLRTEFCFAHYDRGIAHVPCTPQVLDLIGLEAESYSER